MKNHNEEIKVTNLSEPQKKRGWSSWQPVSKCSFTCLVPARGLQMMTRTCEARVCEGVDSTLGTMTSLDQRWEWDFWE